MKSSLREGVTFERRLVVDRDRTISFMGEEGRVYATPSLVHDVEHACRDLILQHLDDGEDSVGTAIAVEHTAATPLGAGVTITVTVAAVDGRRVRLAIAARDDLEAIGTGTHSRFVVDRGKTVARLADKRARLAAANRSAPTANG